MKQVQTVFSVNNSKEGQVFEGFGQQPVSDALKSFPGQVIKLEGHLVNGEFKKADLSPHWERTQQKKEANKSN